MEASGRRSRRLALIAAAALVAGAGAGGWWWLRDGAPEPPRPIGTQAGETIAAGAVGAIAVAEEIREPYRCARWDVGGEPDQDADAGAGAGDEPDVITAFGRTFEHVGRVLRVEGGDRRLVIGFIADTRGAAEATLANLAALREQFEAHGVELVVTLGGLATDADEIAAVLDALSRNARWPVLAIPGGRESLPAHRAAVESIRDGGRGVVFDGAAIRVVAMDGATIGTIPGIAEPGQLTAGNDGCVHEVEQLVKFAESFAQLPAPRVLASYAPPRQGGETGSDVAAGGVHIGEPAIARAVLAAEPTVVVHGLVDEAVAFGAPGKALRPRTRPLLLGAGAAEQNPLWLPDGRVLGASAVVVDVANNRLVWRRVVLPVGVD